MSEPVITCPHCNQEIKLTESLAKPIIQATKLQLEEGHRTREAALAKLEESLQLDRETLTRDRSALAQEIDNQVEAKRQALVEEAKETARLAFEAELRQGTEQVKELQSVIATLNSKLTSAQAAEAEYVRKERALEEAKRELALTIETRVSASLDQAKGEARQQVEAEMQLKLTESEEKIASMKRTIEDLQKKSEQGSQQLQGEALELVLEQALKSSFPLDLIEPVPKGTHGGDIVHRVVSPSGQACGSILWECKRTKNWSAGWLTSLRDDQRQAGADLAVIATQALPKNVISFDCVDEVWVTRHDLAIPLAMALRRVLTESSTARTSAEGQQTKMQLVYQYLLGPQFRQRVEAIVEKFTAMREDLDNERRAMQKSWAKREKQIQVVIESTAGMYGDLQGIAGKSLQEIEGLDIKLLGEGADASA